MKRLLLLSAAATALWVAGAGIADAQGEGPYISLGGGWSSLDPVKFNIGGSVGPISGKSSFTNDAAVNFSAGYKFELPVRVEAEVKYTDFDARRLALSTLPAAAVANGDLGVTSFFANVLYDYPLSRRFAFTIGGGIGAALADANLSDRIGDQILRTGTGFSWQGIAGLTISLSETLPDAARLSLSIHRRHGSRVHFARGHGRRLAQVEKYPGGDAQLPLVREFARAAAPASPAAAARRLLLLRHLHRP